MAPASRGVTDTTAPPQLKRWVQVLQLDAGVLGPELPVDAAAGGVAPRFPGGDLPLQGRPIRDAAVEALAGQDAQLDLGDVEPAAVRRGVVQLQLLREPSGLGRRERLVQRARGV